MNTARREEFPMNKKKNVVIQAKPGKMTMTIKKPTLYISTSLSLQHIKSAALFSRLSAAVEKKYDVKKQIKGLSLQNKAYVMGTIISAFSFLDSTINELFWATIKNRKKVEALGMETVKILSSMWKQGVHRAKTLEKYQIALVLAKRKVFDKGATPYQNVDLVRRLRNALIHFEPEWVGEEPQKLEENLRGKFNLSPFSGSGSLYFPHRCLSHGCAEWVVNSCLEFSDEFHNRMAIKPNYDYLRKSLITL